MQMASFGAAMRRFLNTETARVYRTSRRLPTQSPQFAKLGDVVLLKAHLALETTLGLADISCTLLFTVSSVDGSHGGSLFAILFGDI